MGDAGLRLFENRVRLKSTVVRVCFFVITERRGIPLTSIMNHGRKPNVSASVAKNGRKYFTLQCWIREAVIRYRPVLAPWRWGSQATFVGFDGYCFVYRRSVLLKEKGSRTSFIYSTTFVKT